ncbi:hypothetical protein ACH41E_22975 [Streptomyces sp. NPDC020412]|uniref:hypothetical protein n=1 Tax=Streptomyces sp. NPDC020412 TaxID=3365073 RepID=UPI0037A16479
MMWVQGRGGTNEGAGAEAGVVAGVPYDELAEFYRVIDTALAACADFRGALEQMEHSLVELRALRRPGPPPVVLGGGATREAWAEFSAAFQALNGALTHARVEGYRAAVDEGGLTLSELARMSGRSRQQVTRLVNRGRDAHVAPPGRS